MLPLLIDKEPDAAQAAVLARHFGEPEPIAVTESTDEPTLAAAISALVGELRLAREERATVGARLDELEAVVKALGGPALEGTGVPASPQGNGG